MSDENKTLNRGLDALLGQNNVKQRSVKEVDLLKIKPGRFQPRSNFDNEAGGAYCINKESRRAITNIGKRAWSQ